MYNKNTIALFHVVNVLLVIIIIEIFVPATHDLKFVCIFMNITIL